MVPATPRRTQQQRREETIGRLLDAAAETVNELGYSRTTVQQICDRAGLSQGALFRHFPTRKAVMIATAQRVAQQQTDEFIEQWAHIPSSPDSALDALRLVRSLMRSPGNQVWHELLLAARTDEELRAELRPVMRQFHRRTGLAAFDHVDTPFSATEEFQLMLRISVHYLEAEAASSAINPDDERDDRTLQMLARLWLLVRASAGG